jgi:hypothetical protein
MITSGWDLGPPIEGAMDESQDETLSKRSLRPDLFLAVLIVSVCIVAIATSGSSTTHWYCPLGSSLGPPGTFTYHGLHCHS